MANEQNNEQNNEQKNDPKNQARNLFFQSALTQVQIAELIGVSQKTVSLWINEDKWKKIRETASEAPAVIIDSMISELAEINHAIASRKPGQRFATVQEAEVRRKIMMSIKYVKEQQNSSAYAEVMMNFMHFVRRQKAPELKPIAELADKFLKGERQVVLNPPFKPYSLPGQIEFPNPFGTQPANNDNPPNTPPPPPNENNKPGSLNEAA